MSQNVRRTNTKTCCVCGQTKTENGKNFYAGPTCGACYQKRYKLENPEKYRDTKLRHLYGLSLIEFNKKLAAQSHKCEICGTSENKAASGKVHNFVVDHNHETGKVRGLLCHNCNKNVGAVENWLEEIQAYLKKY
jgi:hypothetical protein